MVYFFRADVLFSIQNARLWPILGLVGSACFSITGQFMQKTLEDNQNENWIALYVINSILQTFDNTLNLFFAQLVNIWKGLQNSLALFRLLWSPRNFIHQLFPPPKKSVKAKMDFFSPHPSDLLSERSHVSTTGLQCSRRRWNQNASDSLTHPFTGHYFDS